MKLLIIVMKEEILYNPSLDDEYDEFQTFVLLFALLVKIPMLIPLYADMIIALIVDRD